MTSHRSLLHAALLAVGLLAAGTPAVLAQSAPGAAPSAGMTAQRQATPGKYIEGRIAFLRTELKITPAQTALFDSFAEAMRQNTRAMGARIEKAHADRDAGKATNALQRMESRSESLKLQSEQSLRLLDAFKPLYAALSDEQKTTADELLSRRQGKQRRMMR